MTGAAPAVGTTIRAAPDSPATRRVKGATENDDDWLFEEEEGLAACDEPKRPL